MLLKLLTIDTGILALRSLSPKFKQYVNLHPTLLRYFYYTLLSLLSLIIPLNEYETLAILILAPCFSRYIIDTLAIDIIYNDVMQVIHSISYNLICKITIYYLSELCEGSIPQKDVDELYGRISKYNTTSLGKKFVGILLYNKFYTLLGYHNHKYQVQVASDETLILDIIKNKGVAKLLGGKYLTITLNVLYFRYTTLRGGVDTFFLRLRNIYAYYNLYLLLMLVIKLINITDVTLYNVLIVISLQITLASLLGHVTLKQPTISYNILLVILFDKLSSMTPFIMPLILIWPQQLTATTIYETIKYLIINVNWRVNIKYTILIAVISYNISRSVHPMSYLYINLLILLHQVIKLLHLIFTRSQYNTITTGNFEYEFIDKPIVNSVNQQVDGKVDGKVDDDDYVLL